MDIQKLLPFYRFIYERQRIWCKREQGLPFPWTDDVVLSSYKFCNVYRQLDKGTREIVNLLESTDLSPEYKLFNIIAYRFFNRSETIRVLFRGGLDPENFDVDDQIMYFDACHARGPIFNDAYVISPQVYKEGIRSKDKHVQILYMLDDIRSNLSHSVRCLSDGAGLDIFESLPMVGKFLAGQMMLDCTYSTNVQGVPDLTPLTANDFLIVGPGAKWGLDILWKKKLTPVEADQACRYLYKMQKNAFQILKGEGMNFEDVRWHTTSYPEPQYLALHDIQNSLCEFRKYHRLTHERQGRRRLFRAT